MSRTRKDSNQNRVLELVKRDDGTFDLYLNRKLDRGRISEDGLPKELCMRFGFCGDEYDAILREVNQPARKRFFSDNARSIAIAINCAVLSVKACLRQSL